MPEDNELQIPTTSEGLAAATEQAEEYESFLRPLEVKTREGVWKVTHPNMLDDDAAEEYEQLRWESNQCDRITEEVPETTITGKDGTVTVIAAHTEVGGFIDPYQKDGVRMAPSYNIRMTKILLGGDEEYQKFKAAGGSSNAVALEFRKRADELMKRRAADSKSAGGAVVSQEVSEAD